MVPVDMTRARLSIATAFHAGAMFHSFGIDHKQMICSVDVVHRG